MKYLKTTLLWNSVLCTIAEISFYIDQSAMGKVSDSNEQYSV